MFPLWRGASISRIQRRAVLAAGSSHKIMSDKADLAVQEILTMIGLIQR